MISAYWSQDKSNQCSTFPGSQTGYISWSLVCKDSSNKKTSCSEFIDGAFWKSNPSIVTNATYETGKWTKYFRQHGTYASLFKYRFWMRTPVIDHFQPIWKRPAPMSTDSQKFLTILKNSRKLGLPTMEWQIWPLGYRMLNLGKFSKNCKVGCVFSMVIPPECRMKQ